MKKFSQYINSHEDCGCEDPVQEGFMSGFMAGMPDVRKGEFGTAAGGAAAGLARLVGGAAIKALGKTGTMAYDAARSGAKGAVSDVRGVTKAQGGCARHVEDLWDRIKEYQDYMTKKAAKGPVSDSDTRTFNIMKIQYKKAHEDCAKKMKAGNMKELQKQEDEIEKRDAASFISLPSAPP